MSRLRRTAITLGFTGALMLAAGPAWAHICTNADKPVGAGSAGVVTVELATGEFIPGDVEVNPQGYPQGGFVTLQILLFGQEIAQFDTYTHLTLPEMARNAGSGDDMCDGVGVDDIEACLIEMLGL
jgi:hypothetical protein